MQELIIILKNIGFDANKQVIWVDFETTLEHANNCILKYPASFKTKDGSEVDSNGTITKTTKTVTTDKK